MKTALGMFQIDNGRYPTTQEGLKALIENPSESLTPWHKYMDKDAIPVDPWGNPYIYRQPGANGKDYDVLSRGRDGIEGTADDIIQ
jgi:general secretion pathway protein G